MENTVDVLKAINRLALKILFQPLEQNADIIGGATISGSV